MNAIRVLAAATAVGALVACAGGTKPGTAADRGKAAYEANCLACHQADGAGVRGFQPALVGSAWVQGDAQVLATFVLTGGFDSAGRKLSANENVMPPFMRLDDATLAAILTYVRANFGDRATAVSTEVVAAARALVPPAH
jgi:mono/diheme cytochrome c family protein